jgi:hypothetical protein
VLDCSLHELLTNILEQLFENFSSLQVSTFKFFQFSLQIDSTMTRYALYMLPVAVILAYVATFYYTEACNEAVCASLVSKCILLKDCGCEVKDKGNCTCCKNCTKCLTLSNLYVQCCSCVGKYMLVSTGIQPALSHTPH